ncbi:adenine aminohydrolase [Metschnikowia bicuspidata var. bicuspidata NRRL YB-4993]|uniref:Adenine deaminase n=1 Tax=Metschnikowia bicuspidata var. bicuspidata NRRL YB-4993 TaxID=869754 RepID=A0A1A0H9Y1_9ASCO|nr:adenine aminohydrolase [Metschnikowia bicuspidata var. bicuspidata NRRL YB-4993]OBA20939.1 adenine aminohydrolase [Metschnikowia bicuspidata var. bicuspidata NRRL YB-4993]
MASHACTNEFKQFLTDLPKCEHHLHLEGTLEPSLLFALAKRNNITLPELFPATPDACIDRYANFADLQDFLDHYYIGMSVLIKEEDFYDLAMDYFARAHKDGCLHSEVFFDPQGHVERGISIDVVVQGFDRACKAATAKYGTTNKLIMCLLRHLPAADGLQTLDSAALYFENGTIHGMGLDSAEKPFPPELFTECYSTLKFRFPNVGLTAHAGEEGDHTYVSNSLDLLKVTRIDHGVNSCQDEAVMARLTETQTMLSMCPLSNVKLQVVKDVSELPIKVFLDNNISFSINSDDPAYFGGYILDNYIAVHTRFGFTRDQWCQIVANGISGSWCDEQRKAELRANLEAVRTKYAHLS